MSTEERIQSGLNILRREARGCRGQGWPTYHDIMRRAEDHVWACGGDWFEMKDRFAREITDLLKL